MTVHFDNHVSALQASVVGGAARLHVLDDCAVNVAGYLHLVALALVQIAEANPPAAFSVLGASSGAVGGWPHGFKPDWNRRILAVTHDFELDGVAGAFLPDFHLQLTSIGDRLVVQFDDDIARA